MAPTKTIKLFVTVGFGFMITMKELAAFCGVSVATVSKALNEAPDIGKDTAVRIRMAAKELGYRPNAAARALKTNRTYNVGLLFEDDTSCGLTHEYFVEILDAVKNRLETSGYDVTFISKNVSGVNMSFLEHCRYRNFDGIVIACVDFTDLAVAELVSSGIPAVTIDYIYDGSSAVLSDNAQGMKDLLEYVYSRGHRKIAFLHGEMTAVTRTRLASFHRFAAEKQLNIPQEYVLEARYHDSRTSEEMTGKLLSLKDRPTCILYPDDISLLGGMTEIRRRGLKIPEDISIAGYDGISMTRLLSPQITTLCQDSKMLGTKAAELLLEAIEEPKIYIPKHESVSGKLQAGETVARLE